MIENRTAEYTYDYIVIGAGIVGLSTAWQLQSAYPNRSVLLIDKETDVAKHQTGRNSGVIHSGIYYPPGSLKAEFCRDGLRQTVEFCETHNIKFKQIGKLLVATNPIELQRMHVLYERSKLNGIESELISSEKLSQIEPSIKGLGAIRVPSTGIVDYIGICTKLKDLLENLGAQTHFNSEVLSINEYSENVELVTTSGVYSSKFLISCSGLMADRIVDMMGISRDFAIVPYRGEYFALPKSKSDIVQHLIYPIPNPDLPFLGVHLTPMIDGSITVGPNAVQGWKREGYASFNFSLRDTLDILRFKGFWKVTSKYLLTGLSEWLNSNWKPGYLKLVQKYCADIRLSDLKAYPAGVRAQAVMSDGTLMHDFLFKQTPRSLHVCNAPSPAATSAFPIGRYIIDKIDHDTI